MYLKSKEIATLIKIINTYIQYFDLHLSFYVYDSSCKRTTNFSYLGIKSEDICTTMLARIHSCNICKIARKSNRIFLRLLFLHAYFLLSTKISMQQTCKTLLGKFNPAYQSISPSISALFK